MTAEEYNSLILGSRIQGPSGTIYTITEDGAGDRNLSLASVKEVSYLFILIK